MSFLERALLLQVMSSDPPQDFLASVIAIAPVINALLTTLIAAGVALFVNHKQRALTERDLELKQRQLKKDLFDRRYNVYMATLKYMSYIMTGEYYGFDEDKNQSRDFWTNKELAEVLFKEDVVLFMEEVNATAQALTAHKDPALKRSGAKPPSITERHRLIAEMARLHETRPVIFRPYLRLWAPEDNAAPWP